MDTAADDLRRTGLRNTPQRRAVLAALEHQPHATAAQLALTLGQAGLSRQGMYNVLDDLHRVGLVRCIEPAGSAARYELRVGDNHHHLVCRSCGAVEDVACALGAAPCLDPSEVPAGFAVDEAEVTWWGLCVDCASPGAKQRGNSNRATEPGDGRT